MERLYDFKGFAFLVEQEKVTVVRKPYGLYKSCFLCFVLIAVSLLAIASPIPLYALIHDAQFGNGQMNPLLRLCIFLLFLCMSLIVIFIWSYLVRMLPRLAFPNTLQIAEEEGDLVCRLRLFGIPVWKRQLATPLTLLVSIYGSTEKGWDVHIYITSKRFLNVMLLPPETHARKSRAQKQADARCAVIQGVFETRVKKKIGRGAWVLQPSSNSDNAEAN